MATVQCVYIYQLECSFYSKFVKLRKTSLPFRMWFQDGLGLIPLGWSECSGKRDVKGTSIFSCEERNFWEIFMKTTLWHFIILHIWHGQKYWLTRSYYNCPEARRFTLIERNFEVSIVTTESYRNWETSLFINNEAMQVFKVSKVR